MQRHLEETTIPLVDFDDTPLSEVIDSLRSQIPGVDFAMDPSLHLPGGAGFDHPDSKPVDRKITLKLLDVSAATALEYVSILARLKWKVEADGVRMLPLTTPVGLLQRLDYRLPSDIWGTIRRSHPTDRDVFESVGLTFPEGADVTYDSATKHLTIRNTESNLDLAEVYLDSCYQELAKDRKPILPKPPALKPSVSAEPLPTFSCYVAQVSFQLPQSAFGMFLAELPMMGKALTRAPIFRRLPSP